jgi:type IV secretory pathway VirB10-like protein
VTDLSKEARALLDAARGGDDPGAADQARVREKVMAAVGVGAAAAAGAGAKGSITAGKTVLALVLAGTIATVAYLALRSPERRTDVPENTVPVPVPAPVPEPAPVVTPAPEEIEIEEPAKRPTTRKPVEDTLAAETALLKKANAAIRAGDADGALAAVAEHQKKYPKGHLVEEVAATRVRALCAAGRTGEGMAARDRFLARWPKSVHAPRVQAACD